MADEVLRLARRASDIGLKTKLGAILKIRPQLFKGTRHVSSLSVGFLLKNTSGQDENGLKSVSDSLSALRLEGSSRVTSLPFDPDLVNQRKQVTYYGSAPISRVHFGRVTLFRRSKSRHDVLCVRAYGGNGGSKNKTGYYDILGISAGATQAQIKTAYYKQSFVYHPDRNAGSDEATLRFSEINEAYTVLSNKTLRRKYDRGLLSAADLVGVSKSSSRDPPPAQAKKTASTKATVMGQAEESARMFNFDEFYKAHYGEQLQKERDARVRKREREQKKEEDKASNELSLGLLVVIFLGFLIAIKRG